MKYIKNLDLSESLYEKVNEAVNASGYLKAGKLGVNDQFLGRRSLAWTLSVDLGLKASDEFVGPWLGFDHVSMYAIGKKGGTILNDALTDKYTYEELKAAAAKYLGIKESAEVNEAKKFKPGDKWSNDFDYDGMMKYALKVNHKTPLKTLQKLHDSATDVNYHTPFSGLGNAIDWITDDGVNSQEGKDFMKQFHNDIKAEIKTMG
tara:strand:- start:60 stop:674 length:615 start_codon:yes stop_codon:yes gene_type:complete